MEARKGKAIQRIPALVMQFARLYGMNHGKNEIFDLRDVLYVEDVVEEQRGVVFDNLLPVRDSGQIIMLDEMSSDRLGEGNQWR